MKMRYINTMLVAVTLLASGCVSPVDDSPIAESTDELTSHTTDLGNIPNPGSVLGGRTFDVARGASLTFTTQVNQIRGLVGFSMSPSGIVRESHKVVSGHSTLGGVSTLRVT